MSTPVKDSSNRATRLRMADLVKATGVPKSTILYYVAEGLLPEPERPKPNVALYDPICVDLVNYIRAAQQMHRYPLHWIRTNIQHIMRGASAEQILLLGKKILGEPRELISAEQLCDRAEIDQAALDRYVSLGLVWPTTDGNFDEFDLRMVDMLNRSEQVGIPADAFQGIASAVHQVEEEAAVIVREYVNDGSLTERASVLVDVLGRLQPYLVRRYVERRMV